MRRQQVTADDGGAKHGKTWWRTPPDLFAALDARFRFVVDACAADCNALCSRYWTEAEDALRQDWRQGGYVFCNWPFTKANNPLFTHKMATEARKGAQIVALGPISPNAKWWHTILRSVDEMWCFRGRLGYVDPVTLEVQSGATFESAVYVWNGGPPPECGPFVAPISVRGEPLTDAGRKVWGTTACAPRQGDLF